MDTNPHSLSANGWLEDTSKVQKYVMSDEDYDRRDDTYRKHKEAMRKVRFAYIILHPVLVGGCQDRGKLKPMPPSDRNS